MAKKKLFCIKVWRECEDVYIFHQEREDTPTHDQLLSSINDEDIGYDDEYGKYECFEVQ